MGSALLSASFFVNAGKTNNAIIDQLMVDEEYGMVFIRAIGDTENQPECSGNGQWSYVLPLNSEIQKGTMTSFLLSAYMGGKRIQLIGKNSCDTFSSIETLKRIEFVSQ